MAVGLQPGQNGMYVVGRGFAEELQQADAGVPPFCVEGVVGYEGEVGWFRGFENAVGFVALGEGGAG